MILSKGLCTLRLGPSSHAVGFYVGFYKPGMGGSLLKAKVADRFRKVISDALKQATVCTGGHTIDELPP